MSLRANNQDTVVKHAVQKQKLSLTRDAQEIPQPACTDQPIYKALVRTRSRVLKRVPLCAAGCLLDVVYYFALLFLSISIPHGSLVC